MAVGVEIHTTQLSVIHGQFIFAFGVPSRLEGFDKELKEMARNPENKLFVKANRNRIARLDNLFTEENPV